MDDKKAATHSMEAFHTREKANEGIRVPLWLPTGEKSEHWIQIYGVDSDVFRNSDSLARREGLRISQLTTDEEKEAATTALTFRLRARLVKDWSFPQECSPENVEKFFKEAPQIADAVDRTASSRSLFFGLGSDESLNSQSSNSSSTRPRKAASKAAGTALKKSRVKQDIALRS